MKEYHKIQSIFKRTKKGKFIFWDWSLPELEYLKDNIWIFTEKVDGTNIRVMWDSKGLILGGKTDNAQIPAFLIARLQELFYQKIEIFMEKFPQGVCLYGEGYGAKIQKGGGNYKETQDFVLFDVRVGDWWLQRKDVEDVAKSFKIDVVPIIGEGNLMEAILIASEGFKSKWGNFNAEGIVLRPKTELYTRSGHRIITKLKEKDFKL